MTATSAPSPDVMRAQRRRAIVASTVGTTIEWYDFFLYGTAAALVFPQLFFPGESDRSPASCWRSAPSSSGFAARPIGAAIFGHFGDRIGRKATLVATLLLMGIGTVLIGLLPDLRHDRHRRADPADAAAHRSRASASAASGAAPCCWRWSGARASGAGSCASWPQMGVPLGLLLSTGLVQMISGVTGDRASTTWGWRMPFLLSVVLIGVGLYVRLRVLESPEFAEVRKKKAVVKHAGARGRSAPSRGRSSRRRSSGCRSRRRSTSSSPSC